jgi:DnaJ-class molecular chaperone
MELNGSPILKSFDWNAKTLYTAKDILAKDWPKQETFTVDGERPIPKGIDANEIITLHNKGNVYISNGSVTYSNIKTVICLLNHEVFERIGLDIIFIKTITLKEALLGFTFNLNHINNKNFKITCSEIVNFNYEKLFPKMGFMRDTFVGNLIIKFTITFPLAISQESKKLLEKAL